MDSPGLFECCLSIVDESMSTVEAGHYWIDNVSPVEISTVHYISLSQINQQLLLNVLQKLELDIESTINYQAVNDIATILPMVDNHISWFISLKKAKESMITHSNWIDLYFSIILPFQNLRDVRSDISNEILKSELRMIYIRLINSIFIKRLNSFGIDEFSFREKLLGDNRQNGETIQFVLVN